MEVIGLLKEEICMANSANGYPVTLKLTTVIRQEGDEETFTFEEYGTITPMGDTLYLRYIENQAGLETPVTFKMTPAGEVSLKRSGQSDVRLQFAPDATIPTRYVTPQGSMSIDVRTNDLKTVLDEDFGHVNVAYSLLAGETLLGDYSLELHFEK